MGFFRKNTLFHLEEALPDHEELRLRFRRKILVLSLLGFLMVLSFPVLKELSASLHLRTETRRLAEKLLETRLLASSARVPISLELRADLGLWKRVFHGDQNNCEREVPGPAEEWVSAAVEWQFRLQKENGELVTGNKLCMHPQKGLLLESTPVEEGKLLLTATEKTEEAGGEKVQAHLLLSQFGTDIQTLSH